MKHSRTMRRCGAWTALWCCLLHGVSPDDVVAEGEPASPPPICEASNFTWETLPDLPEEFGLGGPIVGVHNGVLIVAGGANFPQGPPWAVGERPPGNKVWLDRLYVLEPQSRTGRIEWLDGGRLPAPRAYAAVVSTPQGIYVLGGESVLLGRSPLDEENREDQEERWILPVAVPVADCLRLRWDGEQRRVVVDEGILPPLPRASAYHAAAVIDSKLYVAASHARSEESRRLDEHAFWVIDLPGSPGASPAHAPQWSELTAWPGPPREKMAFAAQMGGADPRFGSQSCLYLISGSTWVRDESGYLDPARFEYFTDAYRYEPGSDRWVRIAELPAVPESRFLDLSQYEFDVSQQRWVTLPAGETGSVGIPTRFDGLPRPAVASAIIPVGQSHLLLFSGDEGWYRTLPLRDRGAFPRDVLAYHTVTDTWVLAGQMPIGVVTTSAVLWEQRIVIPSGETRPGVRTPKVQTLVVQPVSQGFGTVNWVVLIGYLAMLVGIGIYFARREHRTEDYFLAGRRIPWWAAGMSIYVTQLSALTYLALPALAYAENWLTFPGQWAILLIAPLVVACYLPFFRRLNVTTAYEYLERRFGLGVRLYGSLSFIVYQLGRMAIVVYLPALALSAVTGLNVYTAILVMGLLATLYTVLGGMEAVIWTDVAQAIVLWGGLFAMLWVVGIEAGGLTPLLVSAGEQGKLTLFNWNWSLGELAAWLVLLGNVGNQLGPYTIDQAVIQRYLTTRDERDAARGIWLNGWLAVPFSALFFLLGSGLFLYYRSHAGLMAIGAENDSVVPRFVVATLPPGIAGLVIAGVFAASMSSLDSSMHSIATALTTDFHRRFRPQTTDAQALRLARWVTAIVGLIGTLLAMIPVAWDVKSLFLAFQKLLGLVTSGVVGVFLLAIFTRRAHTAGVLTGAACSFAVLLYLSVFTRTNLYLFSLVGIGTSCVTGYLASILLSRQPVDLQGLTWWDLPRELSSDVPVSPESRPPAGES